LAGELAPRVDNKIYNRKKKVKWKWKMENTKCKQSR